MDYPAVLETSTQVDNEMHPGTLQPRGELSANWWAGATAIGTLLICTVIGNSAVLVGLRRTRRAPAHYPLASLAVADLFVGLFVVPVAAMRELFVFQLHWLFCTCWETLDVFCSTASILSLCTLGWERWSGITAPLARAKRAKRAKLFAALVWPISFAVALPTAFIYSPKYPGQTDKACPENMNITYVFVSSVLSFYLPGTVMLVLYARILCALSVPPQIRSHRGQSPRTRVSLVGRPGTRSATAKNCSTPLPVRNAEELPKSPMLLTPKGCKLSLPEGSKQVQCEVPDERKTGDVKSSVGGFMSRQRRATRTIVRLMAMFLACWTPFFIIMPVDSLCDCVQKSICQWFTWLGYTNSALNPLVYAAASPSVRSALRASFSSSARTTEIPMTPTRRS